VKTSIQSSIPPPLIIEAGRADAHYWHDLWRYRELLGFLAWRDIKVRYQQTLLGAAWALIQPLATIAIFTFVFGRLAKMPSGGVPYILVVMSGQLGWQLFANAIGGASGSLVGSAHLISKIYFPRLVMPLSTLAVALVDFFIVLALFAGMSAWFGARPTWHVFLLPAFVILALLLALGDRPLAGGPHRQVSRLSHCRAVRPPNRGIRHPRWVPDGLSAQLARTACAEPNDGSGGRIPVVSAGRRPSILLAGAGRVTQLGHGPRPHRRMVFSPHGKIVR